MNKIPETLKGGQFWHVLYECRPTIITISPDGKGFFAFGQDVLWDLSAVTEWYAEVDIAHVEYDGEVISERGYEASNCLTCGSCGIEGCCPPTRCMVFTCRHSEMYFKDYEILQKQWGILYDFVKAVADDEVYDPENGGLEQIATEVMNEVEDLWPKPPVVKEEPVQPTTINDHRDP